MRPEAEKSASGIRYLGVKMNYFNRETFTNAIENAAWEIWTEVGDGITQSDPISRFRILAVKTATALGLETATGQLDQ